MCLYWSRINILYDSTTKKNHINILQFSSHAIYPIPSIHLRLLSELLKTLIFKAPTGAFIWSRINIFYDSMKKAHINIFYDSGSQTHGGFRINISYEFTFYNSHLIPSTPFHLSILDIYFFVRIIEHIDILSWDRTFHVEAESTFFTILLKYSPHQHFLRFWLSFHNVMIIN